MDEPPQSFHVRQELTSVQFEVTLIRRDFRAYPILDEELDTLASAHSSVNQVFLGIALGALVSVA